MPDAAATVGTATSIYGLPAAGPQVAPSSGSATASGGTSAGTKPLTAGSTRKGGARNPLLVLCLLGAGAYILSRVAEHGVSLGVMVRA